MPTLKEIERHVQKLILTNSKKSGIIDSPTIPRISAYSNGYPARFLEALEETYGTVLGILDRETFLHLVETYAREFPSHSYNISNVSRKFPTFLKSTSALKTFPYLLDVARFEWLLSQSFHAHLEPPIQRSIFQKMTTKSLQKIRFSFQSPLMLFKSTWNIFNIWKENASAQKTSCCLAIYRKEVEVRVRPTKLKEFALLKKLMAGYSLGDSLSNQSPSDLTTWFAEWMEMGWIIKVS